jgi:hypothetical protein
MPFSRYQINPEHIEAIHSAFYKVCDALLLKGEVDDPITEIIVEKIMALAKANEHDAGRLAELVLNDLADEGQTGYSEGLASARNPTSHNPRIEKTEHGPAR